MNIKVANLLTKAVGITGLSLIAYDSHNAGKIKSASHQKQVKARGITNTYMDTLSLKSPSVIQSKIKNKYFNLRLDENITDFFTAISGYVKGAGSMVVNSVVPLALSIGTLAKSKTSTIGKFVSRASAAGLVAYGGLFVGREVLGIGKPKALSEKY